MLDASTAAQNFSDMPDGRVVQIGRARMSDAAFAGRLAWRPVRESAAAFHPACSIRRGLLSDRALVEIFAGQRTEFGAFSLPPAPAAPPSPGRIARGGAARIVSLEVDELVSAWPVR